MKFSYIFLILFSSIYASDCKLNVLGFENNSDYKNISLENMLVWNLSKDGWNVSNLINNKTIDQIPCKKSSYILINDNKILQNSLTKKKSTYSIKKGWNYISSYINGVDVIQTFKDTDIEFVYIYEPRTKAWAGYSPNKKIRDKMYKTRILQLKSIEPDMGFYVYAKQNLSLKIKSIHINKACEKILQNKNHLSVIDSGTKETFSSTDNSVFLKSRYFSHHKKGIYSDSRVMLIYPKLDIKKSEEKKYGIAVPNIRLKYPKIYEEKNFYVYHYNEKKCYKGIFPSNVIPPYPALKEAK